MIIRTHAYLALMTHAINEAISRGHLNVSTANADPLAPPCSVQFEAALASIPLRVWIRDWRFDEALVAVAAWPTKDVERWIGAVGANELAGEVTATGYVTRDKRGALHLPDLLDPKIFIKKSRIQEVAALEVPSSTADPLQLYHRHSGYAIAA